MEPLAFFADQVVLGDLELVEEHLVRLVVDHGVERADPDPVSRLAQIHQENAEAVRLPLHIFEARCSRE